MYESRNQPLISRRRFILRVLAHAVLGVVFVGVSLLIGALGHVWLEDNVHWHDAALNAAMIAGGLGPLVLPETVGGKLFFAFYGAYVSLVLVATFGLVIVPVLHRVLHAFHLED